MFEQVWTLKSLQIRRHPTVHIQIFIFLCAAGDKVLSASGWSPGFVTINKSIIAQNTVNKRYSRYYHLRDQS